MGLFSRFPLINISSLDIFAISVIGLFLIYILQTILSTSASLKQRRDGGKRNVFFREFGCLETVSELEFDRCLHRSACQSPDRAMTILETAGQLSSERRSSRYGNMLHTLRQAAMAGYEGLDCSQL